MKLNLLTKAVSLLRARPMIGGLEISDSAIRFVVWNGKSFQTTGMRLPPGIIVGGQLKDRANFVAALKAMYSQITGGKKFGDKINTIVSLSSVGIYTQVFTLPVIEGDSLDKAIELNIQMISPLEFSESYAGWQFANKEVDKGRLEILSAFVNRSMVDEFVGALREANFLVVSVESRALSIARLLKNVGANYDISKPIILMSVDGSGMDFLIIRHGQLHFDYFVSWKDIQGDAKEISPETFQAAIVRNLHQVTNYYNSHWQEPIGEVLLLATAFRDEVSKIVEENFSIKTIDFTLSTNQAIAPDWYISFGAAVRGLIPRREDKEISLMGIDAQEEFGREQVLSFLRFWRVIMPMSVGILLAAFGGIYFSLGKIEVDLVGQINTNISGSQAKEMSTLGGQVADFNKIVSYLAAAEAGSSLKAPIVKKIVNYANQSNVTLAKFTYTAASVPMSITGSAKSQDDLLDFKKTLESDTGLKALDLPLSNIRITPQGADFSLTVSEK